MNRLMFVRQEAVARRIVLGVFALLLCWGGQSGISDAQDATEQEGAAPSASRVVAGTPLVADPETLAAVSDKLVAATITLRITPRGVEQPAEEISVCSGTLLSNRQAVTCYVGQATDRFRATLPGGMQAAARLVAVDHYSGLSLLELEAAADLPEGCGLPLAEDVPAPGTPVLTAAAAGIEQPALSLGLAGSSDRTLTGAALPPLLECDLRTSETSSGAPVVDLQGALQGVLAVTPAKRGGFSYAIAARYVARLQRAYLEQAPADGGVLVLERRRPVVGLTLGAGEAADAVVVERVSAGGPAAAAGILTGDRVLRVDGRVVRSAYQAVDLILQKLPGESLALELQRGDKTEEMSIVLAGEEGATLVTDAAALAGLQVGPQLTVRALGDGRFSARGTTGEVGIEDSPSEGAAPRDEVELLLAQLAAFEKIIQGMQDELRRRDAAQARTEELIQSLTDQIRELRQKLDATDFNER